MKITNYVYVIFVLVMAGCGQSEPPPINTKAATLEELKAYHETHCQEKFRMHPFCIDVQNEKVHKTNEEMRRKPGALGTIRTPEELFGGKQSSGK